MIESSACDCNRGHASSYDGMCRLCRENTVSRAQAKSVGVRHRGDGLSVEALKVLRGELKRSDVYL